VAPGRENAVVQAPNGAAADVEDLGANRPLHVSGEPQGSFRIRRIRPGANVGEVGDPESS
jgi:hypothetical protein